MVPSSQSDRQAVVSSYTFWLPAIVYSSDRIVSYFLLRYSWGRKHQFNQFGIVGTDLQTTLVWEAHDGVS